MITLDELIQEGCLFERGVSSSDERSRHSFVFQLAPDAIYMTVSANMELQKSLGSLGYYYEYTCCRLRVLNLTTGLVAELVFTLYKTPWRVGGIVKKSSKCMIPFSELKQEGCLFRYGYSAYKELPRDACIFRLMAETVYMTVSANMELQSRLTKWEDLPYEYICHLSLRALNLTTGQIEEFKLTLYGNERPWGVNGLLKVDASS
jgi:hypothetical protein